MASFWVERRVDWWVENLAAWLVGCWVGMLDSVQVASLAASLDDNLVVMKVLLRAV